MCSSDLVPVDLLMGLGHAESTFNPRARSGKDAKGVMQLIDSTAARYGVKDVWDPRQNIHGGARYMRDLLDMFGGDPNLAIAAYNAGEGAVKKYGGIPPFDETRGHVAKVNQLRNLYGQQIQSPAGSPADQLLPSTPTQAQPDLSGLEPIMLSNGQQAYMEKGMTLEETAKRLKDMGVDAVPTRPFIAPNKQPVFVQYDMTDDEALAQMAKDHPELMIREGGKPLKETGGVTGAFKQGVLEAVEPILTGLGGEAQDRKSTRLNSSH